MVQDWAQEGHRKRGPITCENMGEVQAGRRSRDSNSFLSFHQERRELCQEKRTQSHVHELRKMQGTWCSEST